jgi:hypothetical protein
MYEMDGYTIHLHDELKAMLAALAQHFDIVWFTLWKQIVALRERLQQGDRHRGVVGPLAWGERAQTTPDHVHLMRQRRGCEFVARTQRITNGHTHHCADRAVALGGRELIHHHGPPLSSTHSG